MKNKKIDFANNNERDRRLPTKCPACKSPMGLWRWVNYKRINNDELEIAEEFESQCYSCKRFAHLMYDPTDGKPILNIKDRGFMIRNSSKAKPSY